MDIPFELLKWSVSIIIAAIAAGILVIVPWFVHGTITGKFDL